jgi:hypothetical protein
VHGQSAGGPGGQFVANAYRGAINIPVVSAYPSTPLNGDIVYKYDGVNPANIAIYIDGDGWRDFITYA